MKVQKGRLINVSSAVMSTSAIRTGVIASGSFLRSSFRAILSGEARALLGGGLIVAGGFGLLFVVISGAGLIALGSSACQRDQPRLLFPFGRSSRWLKRALSKFTYESNPLFVRFRSAFTFVERRQRQVFK